MLKIDKVAWAKVKINGRDFWQVLLIGQKIIPRKVTEIKEKNGTDHLIEENEKSLLLSEKPEVILIANGWSGVLKIDQDFRKKIKEKGIELRVVLTPKVVRAYNELVQKGKRVNAFIHTTC